MQTTSKIATSASVASVKAVNPPTAKELQTAREVFARIKDAVAKQDFRAFLAEISLGPKGTYLQAAKWFSDLKAANIAGWQLGDFIYNGPDGMGGNVTNAPPYTWVWFAKKADGIKVTGLETAGL